MSPAQNLWSFLDSSNNIYHVILDRHGNYTYINHFFRAIFAVPGQDLIGSSFFNGIFPEDLVLCEQAISSCLSDAGKTIAISIRKSGAVGTYHRILCECVSVQDDSQLLPSIQCIGYDISEAEKAALPLSQAKRLEQKIRENEQRWMYALEGSNQGLFDWDMQTNQIFYSGRLKKMLGYNDNEMANTIAEWEKRIHPEDRKRVEQDVEIHSHAANPYYENIYRILCKDGSYKWIMGRGMIINKSAEGKPLRMIGTHTDITHLKEAEQRIAASEERLAEAQRIANIGSWDFDVQKNIFYWSDEIYNLLGIEKEKTIASREVLYGAMHSEDREMFQKYELTMFEEKKPLNIVHRIIRPNGEIRYMHAIGEPVLDETGSLQWIRGTVQDVTLRIEAENAIRQSEEKYRLLFYSNPQPMWVYDDETYHFLEVNEAAIMHYGYTREEFLDMTIKEIRPREDVPYLLQDLRGEKESLPQQYKKGFWQHYKKNGELIFVEIKSHSIDFNGRKAHLVLSSDVTIKVEAEQKLVESNRRFRYAAKASSDAIWDFDIVTGNIILGDGFETLFGYKINEQGNNIDDWRGHIHPDDINRVSHRFEEFIYRSPENFWTDEYRYLRADGSIAFVIDRGIIIRDDNGKAYRVVGAMMDLTERKQLEAELAEQKILQQRRITEAAIQIQEKEREEIGKELHDNINQILTTTKLYLDMAMNDVEIREELLKRSFSNVSRAIEEIRHLTKTLVPPSLGDIGLKEAVSEMIEHLNLAQKLKINLKTNGLKRTTIPGPLKLMSFRITQEQLHNIIKHSKATEVNIRLEVSKKLLNIIIEDNGKGFDPSKKTKGIGLTNIRSRAEVHKGKVIIESAPGKGCILKVIIPL